MYIMNKVGIVSCFTAQSNIISLARNLQQYNQTILAGGISEVERQHDVEVLYQWDLFSA